MKRLIAFSILLVLAGCQTNKQFSEEMKTKIMNDVKRDDITGRMHILFEGVDEKNWEKARDVLSDVIELDMGNGIEKKTSHEVIEIWKKATQGLVGTHHQVSNYGIYVDNRTAILKFQGTATHFNKKGSKNFYGSYEVHMVQPGNDETYWEWEVTKFIYKNKYTR